MNERPERETLRGGQLEDHRQGPVNTVDQLLADHDTAALGLVLDSQRPADLAHLCRHLDDEERSHVLDVIGAPLAAELDGADYLGLMKTEHQSPGVFW